MDGSSQRPKVNFRNASDFIAMALVLASLAFSSRTSASTSGAYSGSARPPAVSEGEDQSFDAIVNDLSRQVDRPAPSSKAHVGSPTSDSFDAVMFHGGVGLGGVAETLNLPDGKQVYFGQKGIQVSFGIDLFSPNWLAEGTYRNFAQSDSSAIHVALQEFEMKFLYKTMIAPQAGLRAGGGLSARYMTVTEPTSTATVYTTPSGLATIGLDVYLNEKFSLGVDLTGRSSMVSETPDKSSADATLRMDAHF